LKFASTTYIHVSTKEVTDKHLCKQTLLYYITVPANNFLLIIVYVEIAITY